jgi:hypothetical protein
MAGADTAARVGPIAERLLENQYAQENLREAVENLRGAYRRASKRRVKPAEDKKLRQQVREAAASLTEAGKALHSGRRNRRNGGAGGCSSSWDSAQRAWLRPWPRAKIFATRSSERARWCDRAATGHRRPLPQIAPWTEP